MKKGIQVISVSVCAVAFLSVATAGDRFQPTLRTGVAFDAGSASYEFSRSTTFLGYSNDELKLNSVSRPYFALELPYAVTDRFTIALNVDGSYTSKDRLNDSSHITNLAGTTVVYREFDTDDTARWASAELLGSYSLVKDSSFAKDISVVAGLRWDYSDMEFDNAHNNFVSAPTDWLRFKKDSLTPVIGLSGTFNGFRNGIWGGDMHLSVLAGPIINGDVDYRERINNVNTLVYEGDISDGYIAQLFGDVTIMSGKIGATTEGSIALFAQFTKTDEEGSVKCRDLSQPLVTPREFDYDGGGTVGVIGVSAKISF